MYDKNKQLLMANMLGGKRINSSLNNLEMQLRKVCNHPFLIKEYEDEMMSRCKGDKEKEFGMLIEQSGKMLLLDKLV